jgi:hypothetical protein
MPNNAVITELEVLNLLGQQIFTTKPNQDLNSFDLAVSSLQSGTYILKVNNLLSKKLIIE